MYDIPLSVPSIYGEEKSFVNDCLNSGWVSTAGAYVENFEEEIGNYVNSRYAIACVNGTAALQVSLIVVGVKPGDEVIVPSLTFIASVNPIRYIGASPVFMDSNDFFLIDIEKTINFLQNETFFKKGCTYNKTTKNKISAIIPVHVWGNAVLFDELVTICLEMNISIVEDASESLGSRYIEGRFSGKHSGTLGQLGCFSFNGNKIITTGGGGMIVTDNKKLAKKAKYLTTQAKDDAKKYIHHEIGYNFRLTNIQAALGLGQLKNLNQIINRKIDNYNYYKKCIKNIDGLSIYDVPKYSSNNHWINMLRIHELSYGKSLEEIFLKFENSKIETRPVWYLNHLQKPYKDFQFYHIDNAKKLVNNSLCLPSSPNLTYNQIDTIIEVLNG